MTGNDWNELGCRGWLAKLARTTSATLVLLAAALLTGSASGATSVADELREHGLFEAHEEGLGSDLRIAVYEQDACIDRNRSEFSLLTFEARSPDVECNPQGAYSRNGDHSTRAALALATSRRDSQGEYTYQGPFAARLFEVDAYALLGHAGWTELSDRNPDFVSISQVTGSGSAQGMDTLVYEDRIFVANGAGNWASDPMDKARCAAYNALCVGGYSTRGTTSWADDRQSGASWRNHPATGREEPDLAGPYTVEGSGTGTSFATPAVVGLAALLTANHREVLYREPTLMRALLMASASHTVREPMKQPGIPIVGDGVDDRTGAGVPRGDRASAIVEAGHTFARKLDRNRDFDAEGRLGDPIRFDVTKGEVVRAALAWDNCPISQSQGPSDVLVVDLDLTVRGPDHDANDDIRCCADVNLYSTKISPTRSTATRSTATSSRKPRASRGKRSGSEGYDPRYSRSFERFLDRWRAQAEAGRLLGQFDFLGASAKDRTADVSDDVAAGTKEPGPTLDFQQVETVYRNHSRVDNYEIVEFTAPVSGTYEIEVDAERWDVCPFDGGMSTHTAVAWDVWRP